MGENPSARLTLLSTSGEAGFSLLPVYNNTFAMDIYHVFPVSCSSWRFNTCTFHIGTLGTPMRIRLHRGFR